LKVAHNGPEKHPFQKGFERYKEVLEAETEGPVEAQIFPNEQLGTEEEASQMVKLGLIAASADGGAQEVDEDERLGADSGGKACVCA